DEPSREFNSRSNEASIKGFRGVSFHYSETCSILATGYSGSRTSCASVVLQKITRERCRNPESIVRTNCLRKRAKHWRPPVTSNTGRKRSVRRGKRCCGI